MYNKNEITEQNPGLVFFSLLSSYLMTFVFLLFICSRVVFHGLI